VYPGNPLNNFIAEYNYFVPDLPPPHNLLGPFTGTTGGGMVYSCPPGYGLFQFPNEQIPYPNRLGGVSALPFCRPTPQPDLKNAASACGGSGAPPVTAGSGNEQQGNPIHAGVSNKHQSETDYVGPGTFPLHVSTCLQTAVCI
jgi:hypothetical protein